MANAIILYVELEGKVWAVLEDGSWLALQGGLPDSVNVPFIPQLEKQLTLNEDGQPSFDYKGKTIVVDQAELDAAPEFYNVFGQANKSNFTQAQNQIESSGGALGQTTQVDNDGDEVIAQAGFQTRGFVSGYQLPESDDQGPTAPPLAKDATISIVIEDGGDELINQYEVGSVLIHGETFDVDDDREVVVTVIDSDNNSLTFTTTVSNNLWTLDAQDFSSLSQGPITATAEITDFYGTMISASDDSVIDTLAEVSIQFADELTDGVINQSEQSSETISGTTQNIEDGQTVHIVITDSIGATQTLTATVAGDSWEISDDDVSALMDGELTAVATVQDIAGNIATSTTTVMKDTLAEITVVVDSGDDDWLNGEEVGATTIHGSVNGVEDGQQVTIVTTDSDGNQLTFTVVVSGGSYSAPDLDLSTMVDGALSVEASVTDIAGNNASANTSVDIDTSAFITVNIHENGDDYLNAAEITSSEISGYTFKIDDGETITVTVTDSEGASLQFTTVTSGLTYSITEDLSSLAEGELTVTAEVQDSVGNDVTASDTTIKDTQAAITFTIEDGGDGWLNAQEVLSASGFGDATDIEDGQTVTITATDSTGATASITTTISGGTFSVEGLDVSHFAEGEFTVVASVSDVAGNSATATDQVEIDTLASLSLNIETNGDGVLNAAEVTTTKLSGLANDVDDGETVTIVVTDSDGNSLTFTAQTLANSYEVTSADLSTLSDGPLTAVASVTDIHGNPAQVSATADKDTLADITLTLEGNGDDWLNANEVSSVAGFGSVANVEDGQVVTIVATDSAGNNATITATVSGQQYSFSGLDLSGFVEGEFTATATVSDIAGNSATADDTLQIDTLATITLNIESGDDQILNSSEVAVSTLDGTTSGVENGATVSISVTDVNGKSLVFTTSVINNSYTVSGADLSALAEGELTAVASVTDAVGNSATATDTAIKDTLATITINVDSGTDNTLNASEVPQTHIYGEVANVEDGQTVTVIVSDGSNQLTFITSVSSGAWSLESEDLSSLDEGELTFSATVEDIAGNSAAAETIVAKDTLAEVTIHFEQELKDGVLSSDESSNELLYGTVTNIENGQYLDITVTDSAGNTINLSAQVILGAWAIANNDLSSLVDGELTAVVSVSDQAGNPATASTSIIKDTSAEITIVIETGGDDIINSAEVAAVDFHGTTSGVEDGQTVLLTITDINGNSISGISTTVTANSWSIEDVDLSSLEDGLFTAVASTEDIAGNAASAAAQAEKDVLAEITINIDDQGDGYLNAIEVSDTTISGSVQYVEDGQTVEVVIADLPGNQITTSATVTSGSWVVNDLDLSSLDEGELTATATVTDLAGNSVTNSDTVIKDTLANLTVSIDSGGDGVLNADELNPVIVSGHAGNVEAGQVVTFTITDGVTTTGPFSATVQADGSWSSDNNDFSMFNEGDISVNASVLDLSGNTYDAQAEVLKDTLASITIDIKTDSDVDDNVINSNESSATEISGTVLNVEDGQVVTVLVTDGAGGELTFSTSVSAGAWSLPGVDLSSLADGENNITAQASVTDVAGNSATASDIASKDTLADISVQIESGDDNYLNSSEVAAVVVSGTVTNVEDGQIVTLTLSDQDSNKIVVTATASAGQFVTSPAVDLSSFVQGQVEVVAEVSDLAGNSVNASDDALIDTLLSIDIDTNSYNGFDGFDTFNSYAFMNGTHTQIAGTTTAEAGQTVTVAISDGSTTVEFTGSVASDGRWLVENIDISSLDNSQAWSITASVEDIAGNTASDDMPDLKLLDSISLSEDDLDLRSAYGEIAVEIDSINTEVVFTDAQPQLDDITSEGQSLLYEVSEDGLTINVYRSGDSQSVFTAQIDTVSNSVHISMFEPLDHDIDSDSLITELFIKAVQSDDDGTVEESTMPLIFEVVDSYPDAQADSYEVFENTTTSDGNLLDNDSATDGSPLINSVTYNSETQAVSVGSDALFITDKGQLTVSYDGSWTFIAASNLDNSVEQTLSFDYQIIDLDGDLDTTSVTLTIVDGDQGQADDFTGSYTEPTDTVVTAFQQSFTVTAGSDNLDADSIRFSLGSATLLNNLALTSNGELITFVFDSDNAQIIGTTDAGTILTLSVSAVSSGADLSGTLTIEQSLPIDHISSDSLQLEFGVLATDSDGTNSATGKVTWTIYDGENASIENTALIDIDEADLSSGSVQGSGSLTVTPGSDDTVDIAFDISKQPELTSGGETIEYRLNGDVLEGYIGTAPDETLIFDLTLTGTLATQTSSDLGYDFNLYFAIDELDNSGDHLDTLPIDFIVSVTDGDNDVTDQALQVNITDSGDPIISGDGFHVTEEPKAPTTPSAFTNEDSTVITITADQDPVTALTVNVANNDAVTLVDGTAVTQNGEAVLWQVNSDGEYNGVLADGTVVFTLSLPDSLDISAGSSQDITISLELVGPIDHDKTLHDNNLEFAIPLLATDSDNSTVEYDISAYVDDGETPSVGFSDSISVDENDTIDGASKDSVDYTLETGSDEVVSVEPVLAGQVIDGLTSGGNIVTFADSANDDGWWIASSSDGNVFRVRFNLDGTVDFRLNGVVDHPDTTSADTLTITLDVQAIDADGDSATSSISIDIIDDVPDINTDLIVLDEGLSEDLDLLSNNEAGADGGSVTAVTVAGVSYAAGELITLFAADGTEYGSIQINSDGTGELITLSDVFHVGLDIYDEVTYTVTDGDGDSKNSYLILDVADEPGEITIDNTDFIEDVAQDLGLKVSVGDEDNGETIEQVIFDADSLQGGTLTFNGVELATNADGDYILAGSDLVVYATGVYEPDGELIFTPLLNSSDQTQNLTLAISAVISRDVGADETVVNDISLTVTSVADTPTWDDTSSVYQYTLLEDAESQTVSLDAQLFDTDGSEVLTYEIGNIDDGLTLLLNGEALSSGDSVSAADVNAIEVLVDANLAGQFVFEITPVATELENSDSANGETKNIVFEVQPVADQPSLTVFDAHGIEDEIVLLNQAINGELKDTDGSETLTYIISVAEGWSVVAIDGSDAVVTGLGNGSYSVLGSDVESGEVGLLPAANVSSVTGTFEFTAQAVATESTQDGVSPAVETSNSEVKSFEVFLTGVVDTPIVSVGGDWSFDQDTLVISNSTPLYEDQLINLDIDITTVDQDGSESINLLLSNIPEGFEFTNESGDPVEVSISSLDDTGQPIYQVALEDLSALYLKPSIDYSGTVSFNIETVITEADGDAEPDGIDNDKDYDDSQFYLTVELDITPVVDHDSSTIVISDEGKEDFLIALHLLPVVTTSTYIENDVSEEFTSFTIDTLPEGCSLFFDGVEITVPADISDYLDSTNSTLESMLESGRFAITPPTDASGTFYYTVSYEVTDTSESGEMVTKSFTHDAELVVHGQVEDFTQPGDTEINDTTRIEGSTETQVSSDGSAISLDGLVLFYDQDDDGSEHLDYIVIQVPNEEGWVVTHDSNTVIYDGDGRWLIDATGLTSNSVQEDGLDLLAGASIYYNGNTLLSKTIQVAAHVEDGNDKEMIETTLQVNFTGDGSDSNATDIDPLQIDYIEGEEDSSIDIGSQINTDVTDDSNDLISFKVYASDLPHGGAISGSDVITVYGSSGKNVVYYLFTDASLSSLSLEGIEEDFAGTFEVPITTIAVDADSGDTIVDSQTLQFEISPVVDGVTLSIGADEVLEDTLTLLDLSATFADSNQVGEGIESLTGLTLTLVDGGRLFASDGILTEIADGVYQVNDLSQLDAISYQGPLNVSGEVSIEYSAEILDSTTGYSGELTDSSTVTGSIVVEITPVTDQADITVDDVIGFEDTYIDLSSISADFYDDDGSETMTVTITGVPSGAVLVSGTAGSYSTLANNGTDGGSFNGEPTYSWTVTAEQFATLAILPALDFSGDIPLEINAVSYEVATDEYVNTKAGFVVEVNPVADDAQFTNSIDAQTGIEGQVTEFDLTGVSTETDSNETLILTVTVEADSDSSALYELDRIRVDSDEATFVDNGDGSYSATLEIDSNELDGFELLTGPDAFGLFNIEIALATKDSATVGGSVVTDTGDATIINTTLELTAEVDAPILTLESDSVITQVGVDTVLPIDLSLINPDLPDEIGYVEITGVPDGATISNATENAGVWTILQEDLDSALLQGLSSEGEFDLVITPYATLDGDSASAESQSLSVTVSAASTTISGDFYDNLIMGSSGDDQISSGLGSDTIYGGEGSDTFIFTSDEAGNVASPAIDVIKDFQVGVDSIDINDLYVTRGDSDISALIAIEETEGSAVLNVMLSGTDVTQQIIIENTSLEQLYGADTTAVTETEILNQLLADETLVTG